MSLHFYSTTSCRLSDGGAQARTRKRDPELLRSKNIGNSHRGNLQSPRRHLTPPLDTTQSPPPAERPSKCSMVALLHLDYLLTAFQTHHPTSATSTHGTSARKSISTSRTTNAETAVRLVSAFASSVMKRQRGRSGIG